jgi:RNA polymerase sigma-70 factor (ECF subfamily)
MVLGIAALDHAAPRESGVLAKVQRADARWRTIVDENLAPIWRFLRRLGVPADALDDATQQVFLITISRASDITSGSERAFLFGTALRFAHVARRGRAADHTLPEEAVLDAADPAPLPDEIFERKRAHEVLESMLARMSEDLRTSFVMFELEGLSMPEIAQALSIPRGTVASRLRRAREEFAAIAKRMRVTPGREGS